MVHFGIPTGTIIEELSVIWPDGKVGRVPVSSPGQTVEVSYGQADAIFNKPLYETYFTPVSADSRGLNYRHRENEFDDFQNEILLPHRQSTQGPLMATGDVNGDGALAQPASMDWHYVISNAVSDDSSTVINHCRFR